MSAIDVIMIILAAAGLLVGYIRGLIGQVGSLGGIVLGLVACRLLGSQAADLLRCLVPESAQWQSAEFTVPAVASVALFVVVFVATLLAARALKSVVNSLSLGAVDRTLGAVVCVAKYFLALSILLNLLLAVKPDNEVFTTRHAMDNVPFELVLDAAPAVFGMDQMPSATLKAMGGQ